MARKPNILLIYTGGTIGMVKDYKTGALKAFDFSNLRKRIPELKQLNCKIRTVSFEESIDSSNMNTKYWADIAKIIKDNYELVDGFVVLTGSDTMSYTASALSFMLRNLTKPVIFTGSQLPIGDLRTDAKENLITAIQIASVQKNNQPKIQEVCLYFEYKLYRANRTTKINSEHFEAFISPNYPEIAESGVHLIFQEHLLHYNDKNKKIVIKDNFNANVVILKLFPGITNEVVKAILEIKNLEGVVLESYGSGNASTNKTFVELLEKTIKRGIYIINVTQCISGSVIQGQYETSTELKKIGVISGKDLTTEAAITKLMYLLAQNLSKEKFKNIFQKSIRGEMSDI